MDNEYSSTINSLSLELSEKHRVYIIEYPFTIKDVIAKIFHPKIKKRLIPLLTGRKSLRLANNQNVNLFLLTTPALLPINWISNVKVYDFFSKINEMIIRRSVKKIIKSQKIKKFIFVNAFNPAYLKTLDKKMGSIINLYYVVDSMRPNGYLGKHGLRQERIIIEKTDLVLATSKELCRIKSKNTKPTQYLPNAGDSTLFNRAFYEKLDIPEFLIPYKSKKIVCYVGNIEIKRLNLELIKYLAQKIDNVIVLMVGPVNIESGYLASMEMPDNIVFCGSKPLEIMPSILQHTDCTIIPFLLNDQTKSIYPLKINEYLATGKPVVSTAFSEDIEGFKDVICLAQNDSEFIEGVRTELLSDSEDKMKSRVKAASLNTWKNRAKEFESIIENELGRSLNEIE